MIAGKVQYFNNTKKQFLECNWVKIKIGKYYNIYLMMG